MTGFVQTIRGEGMPDYDQSTFGDLFVEYNVVLPATLSTDVKRSKCFPVFSMERVLTRSLRRTELAEVFHDKNRMKDEL